MYWALDSESEFMLAWAGSFSAGLSWTHSFYLWSASGQLSTLFWEVDKMTAGSHGPLGHMPFLKHLMMTWWQHVSKAATTGALWVRACFIIANWPLAEASHVSTDWMRNGEFHVLMEEKNSFLQSLIIFPLAVIFHNPFTHKSYSLCPKAQNSHPHLGSRIRWSLSSPSIAHFIQESLSASHFSD